VQDAIDLRKDEREVELPERAEVAELFQVPRKRLIRDARVQQPLGCRRAPSVRGIRDALQKKNSRRKLQTKDPELSRGRQEAVGIGKSELEVLHDKAQRTAGHKRAAGHKRHGGHLSVWSLQKCVSVGVLDILGCQGINFFQRLNDPYAEPKSIYRGCRRSQRESTEPLQRL